MRDPATPREAYQAIIDQFVDETRNVGSSSHVVKSGIFSKAPAHREFNAFISSLSKEQRELLSRILQEERDDAIHDVLAALSWWIDCRNVGFTFRGEPMPLDVSGMGLHGDYVSRRAGGKWPAGDTQPNS